ncbi:MAG: patatin-like phospholipase family protein [Pseudomonadales bacterium]
MQLPASQSEGIDMLFLSGGGSFGAYGAGVLYGWSAAAGDHVRNPFHVVTGISTGSLQATHAFLGSAYDNYLYDNYTNPGTELMPRRPWWQIPFASSVNETTGLVQVLKDTVPDSMIDDVGLQQGQRLLCVGTTNLDNGDFVTWDLTRIASEGKYDLYRSLLLASASVPAASPPVKIGGALYGDGGVRNQIFATPLVEQLRQGREAAEDRGYFLVNDQLSIQAQCTQPRIIPLAEQTIRILLTGGLNSALYEAEMELTRCSDPGDALGIYFLYIPDNFAMGFDNANFDKDQMCRLFCRGLSDGRQANWSDCRPTGMQSRSCATPIYPPGDTLSDSTCPVGGPPSCPADSVYAPFPSSCSADPCAP